MNHQLTKAESDICRATGVSDQEYLDARASNSSEAKANTSEAAKLAQDVKDMGSAAAVRLTPDELAMCARTGIKPEQFLAAKTQGA